jgi:hypothetical protein
LAPTLTVACSSSARPTDRFPRRQVVPLADGHTVYFGAPTCATGCTLTVATASLLTARVLQTKIV